MKYLKKIFEDNSFELIDMKLIDFYKVNIKFTDTEINELIKIVPELESQEDDTIESLFDDGFLNILKQDDEWYYVHIFNDKISGYSTFYKCDQLYGLIECLKYLRENNLYY